MNKFVSESRRIFLFSHMESPGASAGGKPGRSRVPTNFFVTQNSRELETQAKRKRQHAVVRSPQKDKVCEREEKDAPLVFPAAFLHVHVGKGHASAAGRAGQAVGPAAHGVPHSA